MGSSTPQSNPTQIVHTTIDMSVFQLYIDPTTNTVSKQHVTLKAGSEIMVYASSVQGSSIGENSMMLVLYTPAALEASGGNTPINPPRLFTESAVPFEGSDTEVD